MLSNSNESSVAKYIKLSKISNISNQNLKQKYENPNNNKLGCKLYMTKKNFLEIILGKQKINELHKNKINLRKNLLGKRQARRPGLLFDTITNKYKEVSYYMNDNKKLVEVSGRGFEEIDINDVCLISEERYNSLNSNRNQTKNKEKNKEKDPLEVIKKQLTLIINYLQENINEIDQAVKTNNIINLIYISVAIFGLARQI